MILSKIKRIISPEADADYTVGDTVIMDEVEYPIVEIKLAEDKQSFSVYGKNNILLLTAFTSVFEVRFDPSHEEAIEGVSAGGVKL